MGERREYEMTQEQRDALLKACESVPLIMLQCGTTASQQERANDAWQRLGAELGFDYMTVRPVPGKDTRFFTAIPK